jgi:hypothetical protein
MSPFEFFEIDRRDECTSVAIRYDFAMFLAKSLSDKAADNPALSAFVSQLRASVEVMFGSRRVEDCIHFEDVEVIGPIPTHIPSFGQETR